MSCSQTQRKNFLFSASFLYLGILAFLSSCEVKEPKSTESPIPKEVQAPNPIEIYKAVANKSCSTNEECQVLEMGSRPCGGPSDFVVFSTAQTNPDSLKNLIQEYTQKEKAFNESKQIAGTCEALMAPQASCQQGLCSEMDASNQNASTAQKLIISFLGEDETSEGLSQIQEFLPTLQSKKIFPQPPTYSFTLRGGFRMEQYIPLIKELPQVKNVEKDQNLSTP